MCSRKPADENSNKKDTPKKDTPKKVGNYLQMKIVTKQKK
tara:strand:+ start:1554 stop:1673 length:120 start_codon:yes stop_codon:yes gene_type:complete